MPDYDFGGFLSKVGSRIVWGDGACRVVGVRALRDMLFSGAKDGAEDKNGDSEFPAF